MTSYFKRASILVSTVTVVFQLQACTKGGASHDPVERIDATTIKIYADALGNIKRVKAAISDFPELLYVMGKVGVTEDRTNVVPARVAGRIDHIYFASGEFVIKGQLLASLFSPDFVVAKEEFQQSVRQVKGGSSGDKSDPSNFENLVRLSRKKLETMGLSKEDIDALEATASDSTSGNIDSTNAASNPSAFLTIRAPRSGAIIAKGAVLGNLVNVGDTLFTIADMNKVWFSGDLYPEDLPKIHKDQSVVISVTGVNKPIYGKISFISPMVDPNSRSIKFRALMDNPSGALKADMYVQGSITLKESKALLVPSSAVVRTPDGDVVFKRIGPQTIELGESLSYKKVPVKVDSMRQSMSAIADGLQDGDEVVSDGAWLLESALNSSESK